MPDSSTETEARPTDLPAVDSGDGEVATAAPPRDLEELPGDMIGGISAAGLEAAPTIEPPAAAAAGEAVGLWQSNKTVNALYATAAARNSWLHIASPSVWRRLAPLSDSGVAAMSMLAAHARDRGRPASFREEADGLVHEIYVW